MKHKTKAALGVVLLVACSDVRDEGLPDAPVSVTTTVRNLPTFEAQSELVKGLTPATVKQRFRRSLPPVPTNPAAVHYPPYDLSLSEDAEVANAAKQEIDKNIANSGWEDKAPDGKYRVVFTDLEKREEIEQELDIAELTQMYEEFVARGINRPTEGGAEPPVESEEPSLSAQGLSNAADSRVSKPIGTTYPINHNVLMRTGQINGSCTGQMVGRRLILTAAHCVVASDLVQYNQTYRARRSGATSPYNAENTSAFWWDSQYSANNCHLSYTGAQHAQCAPWDWALLLLRSDAWNGSPNGTPGTFGYWVPGSQIASGSPLNHDGYPVCGSSPSPAGCVSNMAYGQNFGSNAVGFTYPSTGESNFNLYYRVGNDWSGGHSGGPIWSNSYPNSSGPYTLGIAIWQHCDTCATATGDVYTHPNGVRSMSPFLAGFISNQRTAYP